LESVKANDHLGEEEVRQGACVRQVCAPWSLES